MRIASIEVINYRNKSEVNALLVIGNHPLGGFRDVFPGSAKIELSFIPPMMRKRKNIDTFPG